MTSSSRIPGTTKQSPVLAVHLSYSIHETKGRASYGALPFCFQTALRVFDVGGVTKHVLEADSVASKLRATSRPDTALPASRCRSAEAGRRANASG